MTRYVIISRDKTRLAVAEAATAALTNRIAYAADGKLTAVRLTNGKWLVGTGRWEGSGPDTYWQPGNAEVREAEGFYPGFAYQHQPSEGLHFREVGDAAIYAHPNTYTPYGRIAEGLIVDEAHNTPIYRMLLHLAATAPAQAPHRWHDDWPGLEEVLAARADEVPYPFADVPLHNTAAANLAVEQFIALVERGRTSWAHAYIAATQAMDVERWVNSCRLLPTDEYTQLRAIYRVERDHLHPLVEQYRREMPVWEGLEKLPGLRLTYSPHRLPVVLVSPTGIEHLD